MQFFTANGFTLFGKYKGKFFKKLPGDYVTWAIHNIDGFKEELKQARKRRKAMVAQYREGHKEPWKVQPPKPVNDMPEDVTPTKPVKSSCGNDTMANKVMRPPNPKRFTSRAQRIVGATLK